MLKPIIHKSDFVSKTSTLTGGRSLLFFVFLALLSFSTLETVAQNKPLTVAKLTLDVPEASALQNWKAKNPRKPLVFATHYYGFQKGDVLLLNLENEKGKSTYTLDITDYASGSPVFSVKQIKKLKNVRLPITHKAIYQFTLSTDAVEGKTNTCQFIIQRQPAHDSVRQFNNYVTWLSKPDTTWATVKERVLVKTDIVPQTVLDKMFRVEPKANLMANNKADIRFQLPKNTAYWVYWVGVGQEPVVQLNDITKQLTKTASALLAGSNPLIAFGMGLIPYLPQLTTGGNIDYSFLNKTNAAAFLKDGTLKKYEFASGQRIISDYAKVPIVQTPKTEDGALHMVFQNNNAITGLDVTLKIMAFTQEPKYEVRNARKVVKITPKQVPVFGN